MLLSAALFALMPRHETWITSFGQATMYIYLLHSFVLYPIRETGVLTGEHSSALWLVSMVLAAIAISIVLGESARARACSARSSNRSRSGCSRSFPTSGRAAETRQDRDATHERDPASFGGSPRCCIDYLLILAWMAVLFGASMLLLASTGSMPNWLAQGTDGRAAARLRRAGASGRHLPLGHRIVDRRQAHRRQAGPGDARGHARRRPARAARESWSAPVIKLLPWEWAHFWVWQLMAIVLTGGTEFPVWLVAGLISAQVVPVLYVLCVAIQRDRRGPHDLVARTRVVLR